MKTIQLEEAAADELIAVLKRDEAVQLAMGWERAGQRTLKLRRNIEGQLNASEDDDDDEAGLNESDWSRAEKIVRYNGFFQERPAITDEYSIKHVFWTRGRYTIEFFVQNHELVRVELRDNNVLQGLALMQIVEAVSAWAEKAE